MPALDDAMRLGLWVRKYLTASLGNQTPWVQPALALPLAAIHVPATENKVWLLDESALLDTLNPEKPVPDRNIASARVEQIVTELRRLTESPG